MIVVGVKGTVVAIDRTTGSDLWRADLGGGDFVNVVVDGDVILASTRGELHCLDASTGSVRWVNKLAGLGFGLVSIAGGSPQQAMVGEKQRQEKQAAAAAAAGR